MANLPVEQSDFGLFHLLRGALSADFRQTYPSCLKLAALILRILKALCLDVFVPRIFRVLIKPAIAVIDGELTTDVIHDVWGSRSACAVHTDRRSIYFRRRPYHYNRRCSGKLLWKIFLQRLPESIHSIDNSGIIHTVGDTKMSWSPESATRNGKDFSPL